MYELSQAWSGCLKQIFGKIPPQKLGLAISGGVDSMALASLASLWGKTSATELHAYIVDHKLRKESTTEAYEVAEYLQKHLGLNAHILTLQDFFGQPLENKQGNNKTKLEEIARQFRRNAFLEACNAENISHLVLAHHQNDQIELFIQRLLGGSSWFGLAGMSCQSPFSLVNPPEPSTSHLKNLNAASLTLLRPFLQFPKSELRQWCLQHNIKWWEDHTNHDISLTKRNMVRKLYLSKLEPPAFRPENLIPVVNFLGEQRRKVSQIADLTFSQLYNSGDLSYESNIGSATLNITGDLRSLPLVALSETLLRIVAPISPLNEDKLATRRRKLDEVAKLIKDNNINAACINILGVQFTSRKNSPQIDIRPETLRRNQSNLIGVYKATMNWSPWTLIDNRWFMRWRLPTCLHPSHPEKTREFSVWLLSNHSSGFKNVSSMFPVQILDQFKKAPSYRQPLFIWGSSIDRPFVDESNFIGFPTLEPNDCHLDIEIQAKKCSF